VIQVESESPLGNTRLKKKVTANNIVPFARKQEEFNMPASVKVIQTFMNA
jgi:hypothetical protein